MSVSVCVCVRVACGSVCVCGLDNTNQLDKHMRSMFYKHCTHTHVTEFCQTDPPPHLSAIHQHTPPPSHPSSAPAVRKTHQPPPLSSHLSQGSSRLFGSSVSSDNKRVSSPRG